jgi:membrane associated rhomboid family serine protease
MPTCRGCGKELPSFSFGELPELCPQCQRAAVAQPAAIVARPSFPITTLILGINLAVFAAMMLLGVGPRGGGADLIRWGANYGPLTLHGQWWRLITSVFVHTGILHLLVNMWCLWNLGRLAELYLGRAPFALIYFATGLGGGLASLLWHPNIVSAGASGAIFGIAGTLISAARLGAISVPGQELKRYIGSLVPFVIYNLFLGAVVPFIDNAAHTGGLVTGLAFGAFLAYRRRQARTQS